MYVFKLTKVGYLCQKQILFFIVVINGVFNYCFDISLIALGPLVLTSPPLSLPLCPSSFSYNQDQSKRKSGLHFLLKPVHLLCLTSLEKMRTTPGLTS